MAQNRSPEQNLPAKDCGEWTASSNLFSHLMGKKTAETQTSPTSTNIPTLKGKVHPLNSWAAAINAHQNIKWALNQKETVSTAPQAALSSITLSGASS